MKPAAKTTVPVYLSLERDIRRKIESGELAPGVQLPIEHELCRQYEVSRATVRRALGILAEDGLILPVAGRGTFVTDPSDQESNAVRRRRAQVRRAHRTIAALVPCITLGHYPHIMRGIEDECRRQGFQLTMGNFDGDLEKEAEYLRTFVETGVRGVIVSPHYRSHANPQYRVLQQRGIPLVCTDMPLTGLNTDLVATDNVNGAHEGTRRLIDAGCRRIAFVSGWMETVTSQERLSGFRGAMREAKLPVDKALVREGDFSAEFGSAVWRDAFAARSLDGVFCANHPIATGVLRAIAESEVDAGALPVIASFDEPDVPVLHRREVIVVAQPTHEMGVEACRLLVSRIRQIESGDAGEPPDRAPESSFRKILLSPSIRHLRPSPRAGARAGGG